MSNYFDKKDLFLEPKVNQYGSHMVMTNVTKPTKTKYINLDTKFSDDFNYNRCGNSYYNSIESYTFTLPERLTEVKSMKVLSVEIPMSIYNISTSLGNNFFKVVDDTSLISSMIIIDPSNYTIAELQNEINFKLSISTTLSYTASSNFSNLTATGTTYTVFFDTDICGNFDKYNFRSKLGWALGFRDQSYNITSSNTSSESFIDLSNPRYLFLVVDEFNNCVQNTFISPVNGSLMNKKILARISVDKTLYPFGTILHSYENYGSLVSDTRYYSGGKVDIQKLNVQLVNEYGFPMNLNGLDFEFIIEVIFE